MEEIFFFQYHLRCPRESTLRYPIIERKYIIELFIEQKNRENAEIEKSRKSKR